jgi:ribosome modulation factor
MGMNKQAVLKGFEAFQAGLDIDANPYRYQEERRAWSFGYFYAEDFNERAAILEYEAGFDRQAAEQMAKSMIQKGKLFLHKPVDF